MHSVLELQMTATYWGSEKDLASLVVQLSSFVDNENREMRVRYILRSPSPFLCTHCVYSVTFLQGVHCVCSVAFLQGVCEVCMVLQVRPVSVIVDFYIPDVFCYSWYSAQPKPQWSRGKWVHISYIKIQQNAEENLEVMSWNGCCFHCPPRFWEELSQLLSRFSESRFHREEIICLILYECEIYSQDLKLTFKVTK